MKKCRITRKGIRPCAGLSGVLQEPYGRGTRQQGVSLRNLINMKTGKFTRQMVVVKSGDHGKKGIVMNFCPFCAGTIWRPT